MAGIEPARAKTSFDGIYDQPDPRRYFRTLGEFEYATPHYGKQVFRRVLDALPVEQPTVLDLCCSYGINAALLRHHVELKDLYARYTSDEIVDLSAGELSASDGAFYSRGMRHDAPKVIGLDTAGNAVAYAVRTGLLARGVVENLEVGDASNALADVVQSVDLITVTGGISYITERTFARLFACAADDRHRPWVATLCLRTVPFQPIVACLASYGLVTERLAGVTFPQRRFTDDEERSYALAALEALGVDATGREAEGWYHVDVFLSRPVHAAVEQPIEDVLGDLRESTTPFQLF